MMQETKKVRVDSTVFSESIVIVDIIGKSQRGPYTQVRDDI